LVHKNNVLVYAGDLWVRTVQNVAAEYPDVTTAYHHVDATTIYLVTDPARYDVIVTDNLFGDIITDLAAAISGGIGLAASGNVDPSHRNPSMFEPVHGSAPPLAGRDVANPLGAIATVALLLRHGLTLPDAADAVDQAVAAALDAGARTEDLAQSGEQAIGTKEMGTRVVELVLAEALEGLS
jgi:3-isopropylmalate dehydrogenase